MRTTASTGVLVVLINRPAARGILNGASKGTWQPLRWFHQDVVLANWGFFATVLTVAEIAVGLSLLLGIAARLGVTVGLLLIGPIWIMLRHTNTYLLEYPNELFPLLLLGVGRSDRRFRAPVRPRGGELRRGGLAVQQGRVPSLGRYVQDKTTWNAE